MTEPTLLTGAFASTPKPDDAPRYTLKPLRSGRHMLYRDGVPYREATDVEVELLSDESERSNG